MAAESRCAAPTRTSTPARVFLRCAGAARPWATLWRKPRGRRPFPASYGRNVRGYQPPTDFLDGGAHGTTRIGDRRGMLAHSLRHAGDEPIVSAAIPIGRSREPDAVAKRVTDDRRHAGAGAAAGGFNSATDGASDDGRSGPDHEFL